MARISVVGAGVGGLAAASRLAAAGHRVTVFEAGALVGGKAGRLDRLSAEGRFRFDTGPSLLTMPHVFGELFAATGAPLEEVLTLRAANPLTRYRFADGTVLDATDDTQEHGRRLDAAFGPGTGRQWSAVMDRAATMWSAVGERLLGRPRTGRPPLAGPGAIRALSPGRSLHQLADAHLDDPRLRRILERYATYAGTDPRRAPAALATIAYVEQHYGVWTVEGGIQALVDAVADRARACGVELRTATPVTRIIARQRRIQAVELADGQLVASDIVVANADVESTYADLLDTDEPLRRRTAGPTADSLSGFVLLLGLRGRTEGLAHHTVSFGAAPYRDEFDAVFGGRLVDDPTIYVCAPDDPALRPAGHESWFVLVNAARHSSDGAPGTLDWDAPDLARQYSRHVLDRLAQRGLPTADRLLFSEIRTPADLRRSSAAPGGAIYGSAQNGLRASLRRPGNTSPIAGLFLVGGSVHPGGGLPMVARSGQFVADLIGPAD
jgi:phytoene desaturase